MQTTTPHPSDVAPDLTPDDGWEDRWIQAFASHAERRFETRALVSASINGAPPVELAYIYAIRGGGLVLVTAGEDDTGHDHDGDAESRAHDELWSRFRGTGHREIWIASPEQAVFQVERPEEGAFSTGFGRLGASRTPTLLLPRSTTTPIPTGDHDHF